jgi:hypothetical protein
MSKAINFFNLRTFLVLLISQIASFIAIYYDIRFDIDLLLFGLAIGFPLAFSIQSAFKRRDRAIEYLSLFKAGVLTIRHSFLVEEDLTHHQKAESTKIVSNLTDQLTMQLTNRIGNFEPVQQRIVEVMNFIENNRENISNRNILRIVRYLRDVTESSAYLISLVNYRTMAGLRFYALIFISVFPLLQAPILLNKLEYILPTWTLYLFMATSSLLLITLFNFQKMIEYPFNPKGLDNILVTDFKI